MSMIGNLVRIPEKFRVLLENDPNQIMSFLYPEEEPEPTRKEGFLSRSFGKKDSAFSAKGKIAPGLNENNTMDLDKSWHALHFLFTGTDADAAFPEGFLLMGGNSIGNVDVGYGPARSFSPKDVKQVASFLDVLSQDELRNRFDPKRMAELEIYPAIWDRTEDLDEEWGYLQETLVELKQFITTAATEDLALLAYLN